VFDPEEDPPAGCECTEAQRLKDEGTIGCATAENDDVDSPAPCPENCVVCEFCMVKILGCTDVYN